MIDLLTSAVPMINDPRVPATLNNVSDPRMTDLAHSTESEAQDLESQDFEPHDSDLQSSDLQSSEAIGSAPQNRLLQHLLDDETDLDLAFDRIISSEHGNPAERQLLKATMPGDCMRTDEISLATLLASVLSEYEDIEKLIEGFREHETAESSALVDAVAVVTEDELANPEALSLALGDLQENEKFEFLFDTAKKALDRLDVYELSQKPSIELLSLLRSEWKLKTIESLVDFLRSLHTAAETFEAMDLPAFHIREYLRHLYSMRDWQEMARLVGLLEVAVSDLVEATAPVPRSPS